MKKIFIALVTVLSFISLVPSVFAQYGQYGQYTPNTPSQSILIDKQVGRPSTTTKGGIVNYDYVDNLTPSDARFKPGDIVMFKLRIKNTSNTTLTGVTVTDSVPSYVEPIEGPGGYNSSTRILSVDAGNFAPDEEKTYFIKMQIGGQNSLPSDKGLMCITNSARAYNSIVSSNDTAQFCVEKQVIGVKAAPKAGPEMNILLIAGQLGILGLGIKLKKKAI